MPKRYKQIRRFKQRPFVGNYLFASNGQWEEILLKNFYIFQNEGEKGTRLSAGKISDPLPPKVPDYPEEPNLDQTMDMTHIV
jgi:hypothetical protein